MSENDYDAMTGGIGFEPYMSAADHDGASRRAAGRLAENEPEADDAPEADEVTGASPGTAQACSDLGLNSLESNLERFGIKPPGVS